MIGRLVDYYVTTQRAFRATPTCNLVVGEAGLEPAQRVSLPADYR